MLSYVVQESTDEMLKEKSAEIDQLQCELELNQSRLQQAEDNLLAEFQPRPANLTWRRVQDMPNEMNYHPGAVVMRGKVYVAGGSTDFAKSNTVMVYTIQRDSWSMLLRYSFKWFTMCVIDGQLVLVGGVDSTHRRTNEIGVWNERAREWTCPYPPMPTQRSGAAAVAHTTLNGTPWLVIAGGYIEASLESCSRVDVFDASSKQWYSAPHLPMPMCKVSSAVIGNRCYFLGGRDRLSTTTVLRTSLDDLIFQTVLQAARNSGLDPVKDGEPPKESPWQILCESPSERCTIVAARGSLVAVSGLDIFAYHASSKSWEKVGRTLSDRKECACMELSSGELFVVGGYTCHVDICML